jgi:hypothetical protein
MSDDQQFTTESAREAAARDDLADWVRRFLASPGSDNPVLAEMLSDPPRSWLGPVEVPIDQLGRLAGPPGHPVLEEVDDHEWREDVQDLAEIIDDGHEPAPVVASYKDGDLVLEDGNHRVEALRRAGEERAWTVIAFPDDATRDRFIERSESAPT